MHAYISQKCSTRKAIAKIKEKIHVTHKPTPRTANKASMLKYIRL